MQGGRQTLTNKGGKTKSHAKNVYGISSVIGGIAVANDVLKKASQIATHCAGRGYKILTGDESSHILCWNIQNGWVPQRHPIDCAHDSL